MKSHPVSYNCPFTLLFLLPFEPIWLIGQKWGHLCTKALKSGDYLLPLDGGLVPIRSTCCWPWLTWGPNAPPVAPASPFRCLFSERHRRGMQGARPVSLPHGAFRELSFPAFCAGMLQSCPAPTVASEWHLVLGCRTAPRQHPGALALLRRVLPQTSSPAAEHRGKDLVVGNKRSHWATSNETSALLSHTAGLVDATGGNQ